MKFLLLLFLFLTSLFSVTQDVNKIYEKNKNKLEKIILDKKQEDVYKKIISNKDKKIFYELKPIELIEDEFEEQCVEIDSINFDGYTLIAKKTLNDIRIPYLNNCDGIKKLNNLAKKISNIYIDRGYATSRAYLKMQDLSDGEVTISILEGKIDTIKGKNVYIKNTYPNLNNKILNLRDLEAGIIQHERLRSKKVTLKLIPSKRVGYTNVLINGKNVSNPYYGSITLNNGGSKQTGKYQVNNSFTYEDLFGINDILSLSLNTTNRAFEKTNTSLTKSLTYSLPYMKNYFTFSLSNFKYHQTIFDEFNEEIVSNGETNTYTLSHEYNLYNAKQHKLKLNSNLSKNTNENFLNTVKLDLQSYTQTNLDIALKHSYDIENNSYYMIFKIKKNLSTTNEANKKTNKYVKYFLDINYARDILEDYNGKVNSSFHTEYSKNYLLGTEQISIGGPYSVRGFKGASINGYRGFYLRNDVSINKRYNSISLSPFVGLDLGYIKKEKDIDGGYIIGSSLGFRTSYKNNSLSLTFNKALKHTNETRSNTQKIFLISYTYAY